MDDDDVTRPEGRDRVDQIVRGHALQEHGGGGLRRDRGGDRHEPVDGYEGGLGVGARHHRERDPVARPQVLDARPDLEDLPRALRARRVREPHLVGTGTLLHVDHVHAGGLDPHECQAGRGRGPLDVFQSHHVGTTGLTDADRSHLPLLVRRPVRSAACTIRGRRRGPGNEDPAGLRADSSAPAATGTGSPTPTPRRSSARRVAAARTARRRPDTRRRGAGPRR